MITKEEMTTRILARYVCDLKPADLSPAALETAKKAILDLAAASVAGIRTPSAQAVMATAGTFFSAGNATLWFMDRKLSAPGAAFVNSTLASAQDLDDGHRQAMGHPGASVIPAALAIAQETQANGIELLTAIIAGYEVAVRVAAARDHESLDTLASGKWCGFGAAAAGGRLKGLSPDKLAEAMSVAGVLAPGLSAAGYSRVMGNSAKEGIAWSTVTALSALATAENGYTGPVDILDHPSYYFPEAIISGLGETFAIEQLYFKPYSCCRWIHSAIDALSMVISRHSLSPKEITKVDVALFERALQLNNYPDPDSLESAQYSVPFCLGVMAVAGSSAFMPLGPDLLERADIVDFARSITLVEDPELTKLFPKMVPARVTVHTLNNRYTQLVTHPHGDPANPMSWEEIENKLDRLSHPHQGSFNPGRLSRAVQNMENSSLDTLAAAIGSPVVRDTGRSRA